MGKRLKIYNSDFSYLIPETLVYVSATGITDPLIINAVNTFIIKLKMYAIWDKISHAYPILGTTDTQVKFNLKNGDDPLTNAGGGAIVNTIDKGIVLAGVGNSQGDSVDVPLNQTFIQSLRDGNGHALYFINEDLVATNTVVSGLGIPLSNDKYTQSSTPLFHLSGAYGVGGNNIGFASSAKTWVKSGSGFKSKGAFGMVKNGSTVEFVGNGVSLGSGTLAGSNITVAANIRIGDGKYPVANTVSFVSFGNSEMSVSEMITYQNAIIELIQTVHGIVV